MRGSREGDAVKGKREKNTGRQSVAFRRCER